MIFVSFFTSRKRAVADYNGLSLDVKRRKVEHGYLEKMYSIFDDWVLFYVAKVPGVRSTFGTAYQHTRASVQVWWRQFKARSAAAQMLRQLCTEEKVSILGAQSRPPNERVSPLHSPYVTASSFRRLITPDPFSVFKETDYYLNDEIINGYCRLLQYRDTQLCLADPTRTPSFFFSTQFYPQWYDKSPGTG